MCSLVGPAHAVEFPTRSMTLSWSCHVTSFQLTFYFKFLFHCDCFCVKRQSLEVMNMFGAESVPFKREWALASVADGDTSEYCMFEEGSCVNSKSFLWTQSCHV